LYAPVAMKTAAPATSSTTPEMAAAVIILVLRFIVLVRRASPCMGIDSLVVLVIYFGGILLLYGLR
jgi:hypothetical protein